MFRTSRDLIIMFFFNNFFFHKYLLPLNTFVLQETAAKRVGFDQWIDLHN